MDSFQWLDGSPLIYTNWLLPDEINLPNVRHSIQTDIHTSDEFEDSLHHIQPYTAMDTRMCAAMVIDYKRNPWIMVPCNQSVAYDLQMCELPQINNNNHVTGFNTSVEYCSHGWIYITEKCFKLVSETQSGSNSDCRHHSHEDQIDNSVTLTMYILQWFVPEKTVIYDVVIGDNGSYICNICNMTPPMYDGYWRIKYYDANLPCPQIINHQMCFTDHLKPLFGCPLGTFECSDGTCISEAYRCDFHDDCSEGLDEDDCSIYASQTTQYHLSNHDALLSCKCLPWYYCCKTGHCISLSMVSKLYIYRIHPKE